MQRFYRPLYTRTKTSRDNHSNSIITSLTRLGKAWDLLRTWTETYRTPFKTRLRSYTDTANEHDAQLHSTTPFAKPANHRMFWRSE